MARAIDFPDGDDIGDESIAASNRLGEFDLQTSLRLADLDAVILAESVNSVISCRSQSRPISADGLTHCA